MNNQNEAHGTLPEYFSREAELNNEPNQGRIEPPVYGYCEKACWAVRDNLKKGKYT